MIEEMTQEEYEEHCQVMNEIAEERRQEFIQSIEDEYLMFAEHTDFNMCLVTQ